MNTTAFIYNASDIETVQPVSVADIVKQTKERGSRFFTLHSSLFTPSAIYRHQLRIYRRMAQFIDRHLALSNLWLGGWSVALFIYVIMYA